MRWGTVAAGLALAALHRDDSTRLLLLGAPLVLYAAVRTFRPLRYLTDRVESLVMVLGEVTLCLVVVAATGYWDSPYVLCLAAAITAAGFARGFGFSMRTAAAAVAAIAIPYHVSVSGSRPLTSIQWGGELFLIAVVAGYVRRLFGEAEEQSILARQANDLLSQLHLVAQTLPASLDLDEATATTITELRTHFPVDAVAILLCEESADSWSVASAEGVRLPVLEPEIALPPAARRAIREQRPVLTHQLHTSDGPGLSQVATAGLYLPLHARNRLVGLIAIENRDTAHLGEAEVPVAEVVARKAALAIDNARWFSRLRTVGADEERTRIARDLHDRIGQSLAFVSFELDRISRGAGGHPVERDLERLRDEVRNVVSEVRDTLSDLRTDVSEEHDIAQTLAGFLDRVGDRSGITVSFDHNESHRLPVRQEREFWRIAQEAIANAERHASASHLAVRWSCTATAAILEVADDGIGLAKDVPLRADAYGIVGMRERAAAIGARLVLEPARGGGTVVRCELDLT